MARPTKQGWVALGLAAGALIAVVAIAAFGRSNSSPAGPNIIVITTDDQALSTFTRRLMPHTYAGLVDEGTTFSQAIAVPPLCCPFRAGLLSGQYSHNNGVTRNRPGYPELRDPALVLPEFLRAEGYRTGFVGKYLNGTTAALGAQPAPGWDSWYALAGAGGYREAPISVNGEVETLPRGLNITEAFNRAATRFVGEASEGSDPFFLWLAHFAPHADRSGGGPCAGPGLAKAGEADLRRIGSASLPDDPSLHEADRTDKPNLIQGRGPLDAEEQRRQEHAWRCAAAALQPVDRGVAEMLEELARSGELADTLIVFSSDNGINYGHHGLVGKLGIYDPMLRIPLVLRGADGAGGTPEPRTRDELVSQVDITATLLELAPATPCVESDCRTLDGRSLVPLLGGKARAWPDDRAVPLRLGDCTIRAFRSPTMLYASYLVPEPGCHPDGLEAYDLRSDPSQLSSELPEKASARRYLRRRLQALQDCSGIEGRDPRPTDGRSYCE